MNKIAVLELKEIAFGLSWKDSTSAQRLLDVICSILAEEYIMIAKQNPGLFHKQGDVK